MTEPRDPALSSFPEAARALMAGDFSRLEPLFCKAADSSPIVLWYRQGLFQTAPGALAEAFTCACFLGAIDVAEFLLSAGIPPSGGAATGLGALHWAANRGQVGVVRLLLSRNVPLETRNMYGGTPLGAAVWSALNEPMPGQLETIALLLAAGANTSEVSFPTGHAALDALLRSHGKP